MPDQAALPGLLLLQERTPPAAKTVAGYGITTRLIAAAADGPTLGVTGDLSRQDLDEQRKERARIRLRDGPEVVLAPDLIEGRQDGRLEVRGEFVGYAPLACGARATTHQNWHVWRRAC
jgi:hypothetical protein